MDTGTALVKVKALQLQRSTTTEYEKDIAFDAQQAYEEFDVLLKEGQDKGTIRKEANGDYTLIGKKYPEQVEVLTLDTMNNVIVEVANTEPNFKTMSNEDLDATVRKSLNAVDVLSKRMHTIIRKALVKAMEEIKRRYDKGQTVAGYETFYAYVESVGINPNTLRTWRLRYDENGLEQRIRMLVAGPKPKGFSGDPEVWVGMSYDSRKGVVAGILKRAERDKEEALALAEENNACSEEAEEEVSTPTKAEVPPLQKKVKKALVAQKREKEKAQLAKTIAALPNLGFITDNRRVGIVRSLGGDTYQVGFVYEVGLPDCKFYIDGNGIDTIRTLIGKCFDGAKANVKRQDSGYGVDGWGKHGTSGNVRYLYRELDDHLEYALKDAERIKELLQQTLGVSNAIRKGVTKNISGVQTEELKKNIEVLNAITKALKAAQKLTAKVVLPSLRK
jgi:hypothetical protein